MFTDPLLLLWIGGYAGVQVGLLNVARLAARDDNPLSAVVVYAAVGDSALLTFCYALFAVVRVFELLAA